MAEYGSKIDHYVFVMVNEQEEQSMLLKCMNCMHHPIALLGDEANRLNSEYFVVEKHSDEIEGKPKYQHLMDSIQRADLYEEEYGLLSYIKNTILISTFTIFINGQNAFPYHPLAIATVDISNIGGENYMYINGLADSAVFHSCASHMMQSIKMIAATYNCLEIRFRCDAEFENTIKWYKHQGFTKIDRDTIFTEGLLHNLVYIPSKCDTFYTRDIIEGEVSVLTEDL